MSEEKAAYPIGSIRKEPKFNGCADVQTLIHSINAAREKGALFFLAVQLAPMLDEHYKQNEALSPVELETLVAQAAKTMLGG